MTAMALYFCSMLLMIAWLYTKVGDSWDDRDGAVLLLHVTDDRLAVHQSW
jgi:hypothetical protein